MEEEHRTRRQETCILCGALPSARRVTLNESLHLSWVQSPSFQVVCITPNMCEQNCLQGFEEMKFLHKSTGVFSGTLRRLLLWRLPPSLGAPFVATTLETERGFCSKLSHLICSGRATVLWLSMWALQPEGLDLISASSSVKQGWR